MLTRDRDTDMLILECTEIFEVIPVTAIVHNVHLITYFDSPSSAGDSLKAKKMYIALRNIFLTIIVIDTLISNSTSSGYSPDISAQN